MFVLPERIGSSKRPDRFLGALTGIAASSTSDTGSTIATGQYKILDVNPRIGRGVSPSVDVYGMDVVPAIYPDLTGPTASDSCPGLWNRRLRQEDSESSSFWEGSA